MARGMQQCMPCSCVAGEGRSAPAPWRTGVACRDGHPPATLRGFGSWRRDASWMQAPLLPLPTVAPGGKRRGRTESSTSSNVSALLRKNRLLKQREWGQLSCGCCGLPPLIPFALFCEVLLPIGLVAFLWWARYKCVDSGQCVEITLEGWGGDVPTGSRSTTCDPHAHMPDGTPVTCTPWTQDFQYSRTQDDTGVGDGGAAGPGHHHFHGGGQNSGFQGTANFYDVLMGATQNQQRIALSVDHASDIPKVAAMRSWIHTNWYPGGAGPCLKESQPFDPENPCAQQARWLGFANITLEKVYLEDELLEYLDSSGYGVDANSPPVAIGIHFYNIPGAGAKGQPGDWSYAIRMNFTNGDVPPTSEGKVRRLQRWLDMSNAKTYMQSGFVATQLMLDRYIIGVRNETLKTEAILQHYQYDWAQQPIKNPAAFAEADQLAEPLRYVPNRLEVSPFPISGFNEDRFYTLIKDVVPMYFILTFLYTQKKVINEMIEEKESKVRESLRMLGTSNAALIGSWYITYAVIFAVLCGIFTVMASLKVFSYTSMGVLFIFFWTWCMSFVAFGFFVQAFFDKARTGGIVGMLASFSQWVLFTGITSSLQPTQSVMLSLMLLPNCAFCSGVQLLAEFESSQIGVTWETIHLDVNNISMLMVLGMMVLDTVTFTFLGWYLDNVLPSEYGVRQPPWFCFLGSYWRSSTLDGTDDFNEHDSGQPEESDNYNRLIEPPSTSQAQAEQAGRCVKCNKLRKVFSTPAGPKVAVDSLTLTMYEGEIFALLGHNGAGKTTTLQMLTGMTGPTSGTATVYGKDILSDMNQIRKSIGVCPQHDVLWLPLTVEEHLGIYGKLRGIPAADIPPAIVQLLQDVGLTEKVHTPAEELSGGQKRKLSLCLALIGNVNTVILDEPTSGMDPYSRRSTWNILQDCRQGRTLILTTHFMDEADMLGDRIAILAEGKLRVDGSSLFLKNRFGGGYHLTLSRSIGATVPGTEILQTVHMSVPGARMLTDVGAEVSIQLPKDSADQFSKLFEHLDAGKGELQVEHYGLSQATLEEIFLKIASNEDLDDGEEVTDMPTLTNLGESIADMQESTVILRHYAALVTKRMQYGRRDYKNLACVTLLPVLLLIGGLALLKWAGSPVQPPLTMSTSQLEETPVPVPFNASWESSSLTTLAIQRLGSDKQIDRLPQQANTVNGTGTIFGVSYIEGVPCSVQCPKLDAPTCSVISEAMHLSSQTGFGITCSSTAKSCKQDIANACGNNAAGCVRACMNAAGAQGNQQLCQQTCTQACSATSPAPADLCLLISGNGTIGSMCRSMCNTCPSKSPDTSCVPGESDAADPAALLSMAVQLYRDGLASTPRHVTYGAVLIPKPTDYSGVTSSILINTTARHAVPVYVNLGNDALKKAASGVVSSITTVSHPFPVSRFFEAVITNALALASTFFIMIAFAFIPASVVAFVVKEREASHNSKHQQMISGASIPAFWLANYTWDVCVYALPCGLSLLAVHVFNIGAFTGTAQAFTVVILLFVGYGLAIMPFTYMLSFLWKSHTQAQIWCLLLNLLSGLILMIASFVMGLIETTQDTNKALIWLYRLFPGFCLGNGLFQVATNSLIETLVGHSGITMHVDLYDWDICGKDILYLYVTAPCYFLIVVIIDSILQFPAIATKLSSDPTVAADHFIDDMDVIAEERRMDTDTDDVVRLRRLRKVYPSSRGPKVAVRGLSFGMPRGECFGFLGINGAGKTSTLNMLTGAVLPSSGDAWLGGKHILTQQKAVRRLIGYCPQHDALLDLLTVREHLMFFGRLKGVSSARLSQMVKQLMEMLNLSEHEHKLSYTLSGGNKRKLSVGIALIGSPPLIFLDEPSTGVDPAARRFMWSVISNLSTMSKSCSVVLTTHVMEEAEALCGRIGIMVGGRLRCLGSGQHLKGRFGTGYQLEFKLRGPTFQEIEAIHRKHFKVGTAGLHVPAPQVEAVCDALGDVARYREIREDGHGHVVYHALQQDPNGCPAHIFMEWWLIADTADRAISFINEKFAGSVLLERHELSMRYRLSSETALSSVFRVLEADKEKISMEEYGVCQTSLEQIFNSFAAMQEEETGAVRGVVQLPQSQPGSLQKA